MSLIIRKKPEPTCCTQEFLHQGNAAVLKIKPDSGGAPRDSDLQLSTMLSTLTILTQNRDALKKRALDVDFADEAAALTQEKILSQADTAIFAQVNQFSHAVFSLITND